jgi:exopolyphosphatase/guanosine-5'-triphosphate,3'-diphosphate pyrophosphatase
MGCGTLSERYFAEGRLSGKRMVRARMAARLELEPVQAAFRRRGWDQAVGSSGTIRAIGEAIRELDPLSQGITPDGIERLLRELGSHTNLRELALPSVTEERRAVFAGGVAILAEIFEVLGLKRMQIADGAMREGLLYDLVGRFTNEDARERTVRAMQRRYHVDLAQAERVEDTVVDFLASARVPWGLDDPLSEQILRWAARLHEIGLDVSHSRYHHHGAYLLRYADMFGFPREEQRLLSLVVGGHRRKLVLEGVEELIPPWDRRALHLVVLLRLAVLLHRGRSDATRPKIGLVAKPRALELNFPARWLADHPLTAADLQQEIEFLKAHDFRLRVYTAGR